MKITHAYEGLGDAYRKSRRGNPDFASFVVTSARFDELPSAAPLELVELGVGSGQQTEFIERELLHRGRTRYTIHAYDKSKRDSPEDEPGQLDILAQRMASGEISRRVKPVHLDFAGAGLPHEPGSIDMVYMSHVFHHLENKPAVLEEIHRVLKPGGSLFILGVALEHLRNHTLDEFFPDKLRYEATRYPTLRRYRRLFRVAGMTWQRPHHFSVNQEGVIDAVFLEAVKNTTMDSVLAMIRDEDPRSFQEGVAKIKRIVAQGEASGHPRRVHRISPARAFWGFNV